MGGSATDADSSGDVESYFGPLAVLDDQSSGADATLGGRGPLRIDDRCVWLQTDDRGRVLLAWRAGDVSWSETDQSITMRTATGNIELIEGDQITVGGSETSTMCSSEGRERVVSSCTATTPCGPTSPRWSDQSS